MKNFSPILITVSVVFAILVIIVLLNNSSSSSSSTSSTSPTEPAQSETTVEQPKEAPESTMPIVQNNTDKKTYTQPFAMNLKDGADYKAEIYLSNGVIKLDLFEKDAPKTVNNFVSLAKDGFYDGLIFHRIIPDFMIQGGDPLGMGYGGPGYKFEDEFNSQKLVKGSLAMANSGPNTNGSQFFIVTANETPWLDGKHTNFGIVTEGIELVDAVSKVKTDSNDKPITPVKIEKIVIIEN